MEGQGLLPLVEAVFREGRAVRFELEYDTSRLEGLTFQRTASVILDVAIFPIRDAAGRVTNAVIQHIDITERKQAEEALRESEERFSKVFHSSALGIAISSMRDGRIIDVNDTLLEALGRSREEVVGRSAAEHGIWTDSTDREKMVQALQAGAAISDLEVEVRGKTGGTLWAHVSAVMIELDGEPCLLTMSWDVTEQRQAEEALRRSEQRFSKVFHTAPIGICYFQD